MKDEDKENASRAVDDLDRRQEHRLPISVRVDYKRMNTFFADYAKNISKGGTFIRTSSPHEVGAQLTFQMSFPGLPQPLELQGIVMWVVLDDAATENRPAGMGIKFVFERNEDKEAFDNFVECLMNETLGEHLTTRLLSKRSRSSD